MDYCVRSVRSVCLVALVGAVVAASGCEKGDPDALPAVPASGTATYKGQPIETGDVTFVPSKGRPAHGLIEKGVFRLSTYADNDGAVPGKHQVAVSSYKEVLITKGASKGDTDRQSLIPRQYGSPGTSNLDVDIPAEGNTKIKLELK